MADSTSIPKKSLGQHWLYDEDSLAAMCEAAALKPTDTVLEIGPGLGTLTKQLVTRVKKVLAVEFDPKLARDLAARVASEKLVVVQQDILHFDFNELEPDYKIVANIPYYLTSNLIRVISEAPNAPTTAVLLVQKEVAQRVAAKPGQMSLLSVTAQYFWQVRLGQVVPAILFTPPPKVDSQILVLTRLDEVLFPAVNRQDFFRLVKAGFSQRRKTLVNSVSAGLHLSKAETIGLLEAADIAVGLRPQNLSLDDWYRLYRAVRQFSQPH